MATVAAGEAFYGPNATALAAAQLPRAVQVCATAIAALRMASLAALPREACGLLFGQAPGPTLRIAAFVQLANLTQAPDRFACEPIAFLRAHDRQRRLGRALVGFAHSHPDGATAPSTTDRRELWRNHLHLIAVPARASGSGVAAWFATADGDFVQLPLSIEPGSGAELS